jgi:TPR repeat protein
MFGVEQACPLCRVALPRGPEKVFDEATRSFVLVGLLVERGYASWSTLPEWAQEELDGALSGLRAAADQGFAAAQYNLGVIYEEGHGVVRNDIEAAQWCRKAAEEGIAVAQCHLGLLYNLGCGVTQSYEVAAQWHKKAAEQGNAQAQC